MAEADSCSHGAWPRAGARTVPCPAPHGTVLMLHVTPWTHRASASLSHSAREETELHGQEEACARPGAGTGIRTQVCSLQSLNLTCAPLRDPPAPLEASTGGEQGRVSPERKQGSPGSSQASASCPRVPGLPPGAPVPTPPTRPPPGPHLVLLRLRAPPAQEASSDILEEDRAFSFRGQEKAETPASLF